MQNEQVGPYVTQWSFDNSEYVPESMRNLSFTWPNIKDEAILKIITGEEQYLCFQEFMLNHLRSRSGNKPIAQSKNSNVLGLSLRAFHIKAIIQTIGSMTEAALRHHALTRGHVLKNNERTLGALVHLWKTKWPSDIKKFTLELDQLVSIRNTIHAYAAEELRKKKMNDDSFWQGLLEIEVDLLDCAKKILREVKQLKTEN